MKRAINSEKTLAYKFPELISEWNYEKNADLTPEKITFGSNKKVWWKCKHGHDWQRSVYARTRNLNSSCPRCRSFGFSHPDLAKERHPKKNGSLTPYDVSYGSTKSVWWKCSKNHEWKALVLNRSGKKSRCPFCSNQKVCKDNCLATINPQLAMEWHPTKNKELKPTDVTPNSGFKVWWICNKGHEWEAEVNSRSKGRGCPTCHESNYISFPSASIFFYVQKLFKDARIEYLIPQSRYKLDIFIPSEKISIEYDGQHFHKNVEKDKEKDEELVEKMPDAKLIRIREPKCPLYESPNPKVFFMYLIDVSEPSLEMTIAKVLNMIKPETTIGIDISKDRGQIQEIVHFNEVKGSLQNKHPQIASEWHPTKNGNLSPSTVLSRSNKKVWWLCKYDHVWEQKVNIRVNGSGCPICSNRKVNEENCLATTHPELTKEWDLTKNGDLTPFDVTYGSNRMVWWICPIDHNHEWKTTIYHRTRTNETNCPICSNRKVNEENCLATTHPELTKEWDLTKNGDLTPFDVTYGSNRMVWWICPINHNHEWKTTIYNRTSTNGTNCPFCSNRRVCKDNCLSTIRPEIAKEWHPNKNGELKPTDVLPMSSKQVWWRCKHGYEWYGRICNRKMPGHQNCPECHKNRGN